MTAEKIKCSYRLAEKHKHRLSVPDFPVYPLVGYYVYRACHITPIPPNRSTHQLKGCSVNTSEIHFSSSHHVSSDLEQRGMFSSKWCQGASENTASLFSFSLLPCLLWAHCFEKRQKAKQTGSREEAMQAASDNQTFSRYRGLFFPLYLSLFLSVLHLAGSSLLGLVLQQMSWLKVPTTISPAPLAPLLLFLQYTVLAQSLGTLAKHRIKWWGTRVVKWKEMGRIEGSRG